LVSSEDGSWYSPGPGVSAAEEREIAKRGTRLLKACPPPPAGVPPAARPNPPPLAPDGDAAVCGAYSPGPGPARGTTLSVRGAVEPNGA
jgi:hypothetical protein